MTMTSGAREETRRIATGFVALAIFSAIALVIGIWAWNRSTGPVTVGRSAYGRGEWRDAAKLARDRLKNFPDDRDALRLLARSLGRLNDDVAAGIYWRLGVEGAEAEDYFLLASTLMRQGEEGRAMVFFERAQSVDPNHAETLNALTRLYEAKSYPTAAAEVARRLAKQPGWEARGNWALGTLLMRRHDGTDAADSLREILRRDPSGEKIGAKPAQVR